MFRVGGKIVTTEIILFVCAVVEDQRHKRGNNVEQTKGLFRELCMLHAHYFLYIQKSSVVAI